MPAFGKDWGCIDGSATVKELGGLLIEHGGAMEKLTDEEFKVAVLAAEAYRNGDAIAITANGDVMHIHRNNKPNSPQEAA